MSPSVALLARCRRMHNTGASPARPARCLLVGGSLLVGCEQADAAPVLAAGNKLVSMGAV